MKKLILSALALCTAASACAWSQKGHDVTARIAERHLTPAAQAAVDSLLEGRTLVYWSNWLDNASHNAPLAYTKTWHYKNIDGSGDYNLSAQHPKGNIITGLTSQIEILSNPAATHAERALALKIVTHLLGDLHQPLHMGLLRDLGGNKVKVKFFDRDTNLHSLWDSNVVETGHKWSYSEWAEQLDRPALTKDADSIVAGDLNDWGMETRGVAQRVYEATPAGTRAEYNYVATWTPVAEQQLLRAGLRLAHVLNSVLDPAYAEAHPSSFAPAK